MSCSGMVCCAIHSEKKYCSIILDSLNLPDVCDCEYARLPCEVGECPNADYCDAEYQLQQILAREERIREKVMKGTL